MCDLSRTNQEPIEENALLNRKIQELRISQADLKQENDALRESVENYRILLEESPDPTFSFTSEGRYRFVNRAFAEGVGMPVEDIIGKSLWDVFDKEEADKRFAALCEVFRTGKEQAIEARVPREGGDRYYVTTMSPIKNMKGDVLFALCSSKNITERKQAEAAANYQHRFLRQVIDADTNLIFVKDREGRYLLANKAMRDAHETSLENIIGKTDEELGARFDERVKRHGDDLEVLGTGSMKFISEEPCTRPSGEVHYYQAYKYPLEDDNGDITKVLGVCVDITERKQMEESLRHSEELFRTSMEMAPDGVYMNDLEGNFLYGNHKAEKITGYRREELIGRNFVESNLLAERSMAKAVDLLKANIEGKSTGPDEIELVRKDGRHALVEINTTLLQQNSRKVVLGFVRDVTERRLFEERKRRLEERLRQAEKMEALGQLAGGVAHDLNNVLGAVIGYAELLLMVKDGASPKRSHLESIMKGADKASAIVQDLLTLTRRGVSGREVLNLNKIVDECKQSPEFEKLCSYHPGLKIETDLQPDLMNIPGSSVHLGKTLFNLISNASEAMATGGVVTVGTANQYLDKPVGGYDCIRNGDYVVLSVSDMGKGIPEADLSHIFEPFFTKKTMGRSGTGLGLTVVWGTVQDHDGYINVRSEEGNGTTFTLYFPATREDVAAEAAAIPISEYMGQGESILVVDDVEEQRDLAADMLRKLNYRVATVAGGEEAIAYLQDRSVDLIMLDMIMEPGMDGLDTYRGVLKIHPNQKAIIISGFSASDRVHDAQALGAGVYVSKPYVLEKLGLAVRKELDRT